MIQSMRTKLLVNGEERASEAPPLTPLVDVLREEFALTGAKAVCREGFCGACTVLMNGRTVLSCLTPLASAEGCAVITIEGVAKGRNLSPVQQALEDFDAVQCGMCFPGMVITLTAFLQERADPTAAEIKAALAGNVCRCTGYERIVEAALAASRAFHRAEAAE
jgi:aerobic carbon-monoxide dehydrogenase small subunit